MTASMKTEPRVLDLERDVPKTPEDILVLRELRRSKTEDALVHVRRLLAPGWTLAAVAARPSFKGCKPFELKFRTATRRIRRDAGTRDRANGA